MTRLWAWERVTQSRKSILADLCTQETFLTFFPSGNSSPSAILLAIWTLQSESSPQSAFASTSTKHCTAHLTCTFTALHLSHLHPHRTSATELRVFLPTLLLFVPPSFSSLGDEKLRAGFVIFLSIICILPCQRGACLPDGSSQIFRL